MKRPIVNLKNNNVGDVDLDDSIFSIKTLPDIINQYLRYQNAKSRQGSHKTKSRSEVSGRSKKPFSQKGTGNARQGSSKPPNFRGGAASMTPVNRDHSFSLNKKEKKLAIKSALSSKLSENNIIFIDSLNIDSFKTRDLNTKLKNFDFKSSPIVASSLTATLGVFTKPLSIASFKPKSQTIHGKSFSSWFPVPEGLKGVAERS